MAALHNVIITVKCNNVATVQQIFHCYSPMKLYVDTKTNLNYCLKYFRNFQKPLI